MRLKRSARCRQWARRPKVAACLSKDFPWEVVLRFLRFHPRSLILLQMVDKNLRHLLTTDHLFWLSVFNREMKNTAFCNRSVSDPHYPQLKLWKYGLHGLPVHVGPVWGDTEPLPEGFNVAFTSYVRRAYALMHGTRCGLCGCRYRHELYWSLRMRVCRLCMRANVISGDELSLRYGVDYSDLLVRHKGRFFFFSSVACCVRNDCVPTVDGIHGMMRQSMPVYLFWVPHLKNLVDLPAMYRLQAERRMAVGRLVGAVRRLWVTSLRLTFSTSRAGSSIDSLVIELYRNEKRRIAYPYGLPRVCAGGPAWVFPDRPRSGQCKVTARTSMDVARFRRLMNDLEDCVVAPCVDS